MIETMLAYAMMYVGTPYIWGGNNPVEGFDCSGYVLECLKSIGVNYSDRTAKDLYFSLSQLHWRSGLKEGSILFFGNTRNNITHVEIALSSELMIGASGGGRKTTTRELAAKDNAFVKVRPISSRSDLVAALIPDIDNMSIPIDEIDKLSPGNNILVDL